MPSLMPTGKQQFFIPGTAIPLVGGKLYTYIAGTSSLKTTWQDAAGTIPNTNPITLDSTGSALVFWTGNYKIVLKDSLGNTVYTVDNYNTDLAAAFQASVASPAGSSIVGFVQAGAGAAARPLQDKARELVSITDYGANEEADDNAAAINKAIIYMQSVGGELLIPGQFRTSANHQIDGAGGIVSVLGNGPAASKLIATGANTPLTITGASECAVRSVGFDKVTRDQAGGNGLRIINTAYAVVDHVTAYGFLNGIKTEAVLTTLLTKVLTRFCDIGMYLARGDASCPNAITLLNCSSSLNNRFALRADEAASLLVLGGSMEGNGWGTQAIADGFHGGMIPDALAGMPVKQFGHVVDTLKNLPPELAEQGQAALAEIKSQFANKVMDAGRSTKGQWNQKAVRAYLANNGERMQQVFTPEEMGKFRTLLDAGDILATDQSYPGAAAQKHNLLRHGTMAAIKSGSTSAGAAIGGPVGAMVGAAVGEKAAGALGDAAALKAAQKRLVPLSSLIDGRQ